jgi:hypothetical protein
LKTKLGTLNKKYEICLDSSSNTDILLSFTALNGVFFFMP